MLIQFGSDIYIFFETSEYFGKPHPSARPRRTTPLVSIDRDLCSSLLCQTRSD